MEGRLGRVDRRSGDDGLEREEAERCRARWDRGESDGSRADWISAETSEAWWSNPGVWNKPIQRRPTGSGRSRGAGSARRDA